MASGRSKVRGIKVGVDRGIKVGVGPKAEKSAEMRKKRRAPPFSLGVVEHDEITADSAPPSTKKNKSDALRVKNSAADSTESFRTKHGIVLAGAAAAVPPAQTFPSLKSEFGISLLSVLRSQGYCAPTPVQAQTWPLALKGHDIIAVSATGSGKTCAFALPVLARLGKRGRARSPPRKAAKVARSTGDAPAGTWTCTVCNNVNWPQRTTCNTRTCQAPRPADLGVATEQPALHGRPAKPQALILAPARELAQQIRDEVEKYARVVSARIVCIYGGVPKGEQAAALMDGGADLVVATPGRCLDFLQRDKLLGTPLCVDSVTYLVLDEADKMLEAGFLPEIHKIVAMCPPGGHVGASDAGRLGLRRQTLCFTATWPPALRVAASTLLAPGAAEVRVAQPGGDTLVANAAVLQRVEVFERHGEKLARLGSILEDALRDGGVCLVFAKTKTRCDWLAKKLSEMDQCAWVQAIHSGKAQRDREDTLQAFRGFAAAPSKRAAVLVATNLAARGLHISGIPLVVVYDFSSAEDYVHQVGRTGRAGSTGKAITFYVSGDGDARPLAELLAHAKQAVPPALLALATLAERPAVAEVPCGADAGCSDAAKDVEAGEARQNRKRKKWAMSRAKCKGHGK